MWQWTLSQYLVETFFMPIRSHTPKWKLVPHLFLKLSSTQEGWTCLAVAIQYSLSYSAHKVCIFIHIAVAILRFGVATNIGQESFLRLMQPHTKVGVGNSLTSYQAHNMHAQTEDISTSPLHSLMGDKNYKYLFACLKAP